MKYGLTAIVVSAVFGAAVASGCQSDTREADRADSWSVSAPDAGTSADTEVARGWTNLGGFGDPVESIVHLNGVTYYKPYYETSEVEAYRSTDGGASWESLSSIGTPVRDFVHLNGVTYVTVKDGEDTEVLRSADGGASWEPLRSTGFDRVVAETSPYGHFTETSTGKFYLGDDKLYRQITDASWSDRPLEVPGRPESLLSVGDRLVYRFDDFSDDVEGNKHRRIAFSTDGGETWETQKRFVRSPTVRAWGRNVFVEAGGTIDAGTYGTYFLHQWHESAESWSVSESSSPYDLRDWRVWRIGGKFYRSNVPRQSTKLDVSDDGREWEELSVDSAAGGDLLPARDVMPEDDTGSAIFAAVARDGGVGLLDSEGTWRSLTDRGPPRGGEPVATGRGFVEEEPGLLFHWFAADRTWSQLDISQRDIVPGELVVTSSGRVLAWQARELFVFRRGRWDWRRENVDDTVSRHYGLGLHPLDVDRLFALGDDRLVAYGSDACLYHADGVSERFERVLGSESAECRSVFPWKMTFYGKFNDLVQGQTGLFFGFGSVVHASNPGNEFAKERCLKQWSAGHCGGGLYRFSPDSREFTEITGDALMPGDFRRPVVSDLAYGGGRLWAAGLHGLAVSTDGGESWASRPSTVVDVTEERIDDLKISEMVATDGRLYGFFSGESIRVAQRVDRKWRILDDEAIGDFHDVDASQDRLFAATDRGVFVRIDGEQRWRPIDDDVPERPAVKIDANLPALVVTFADGETWRRFGR